MIISKQLFAHIHQIQKNTKTTNDYLDMLYVKSKIRSKTQISKELCIHFFSVNSAIPVPLFFLSHQLWIDFTQFSFRIFIANLNMLFINELLHIVQKMKFSVENFFNKCEQIWSFLWNLKTITKSVKHKTNTSSNFVVLDKCRSNIIKALTGK